MSRYVIPDLEHPHHLGELAKLERSAEREALTISPSDFEWHSAPEELRKPLDDVLEAQRAYHTALHALRSEACARRLKAEHNLFLYVLKAEGEDV